MFSHGWPLSADAFEYQMFLLAADGYRVIAHDRRGHGRSDQPWYGNDTYADDLAELRAKLDLKDAVRVGHSTGGGEVACYIARHGTSRVGAYRCGGLGAQSSSIMSVALQQKTQRELKRYEDALDIATTVLSERRQ